MARCNSTSLPNEIPHILRTFIENDRLGKVAKGQTGLPDHRLDAGFIHRRIGRDLLDASPEGDQLTELG